MTSQKFFQLKKPIWRKKQKKKWPRDLRPNSYKKIEKKIQKEKNSKKVSDQKKLQGQKVKRPKKFCGQKVPRPEKFQAR